MSIFFMCLVTFASATQISIELNDVAHLKDEYSGTVLPTVFLNESFECKVVVSGKEDINKQVVIDGLSQFLSKGESSSSSVSIYNGKKNVKTTTTYRLLPVKLGTFSFGPARIDSTVSKKITVRVLKRTREQEALMRSQRATNKKYELFCDLDINKKNVVVGEPIVATLSIYSRGKIAGIDGIQFSKTAGFETKDIGNATQTQEVKDGVLYTVIKKQLRLIPQKAGKTEIDGAQVLYRVQVDNMRGSRSPFAGDAFFSSFFSNQVKQKVATSNTVPVSVDALPQTNKRVDAVGKIIRFEAKIDKAQVDINEPIRFVLEVEGNGNLEYITVPELSLPDSFKSYESKNDLKELDQNNGIKTFEYVVQIAQPGESTIPSQTLVYFDTAFRVYKTVQSKPIVVTVKNMSGRAAYTMPQEDDDVKLVVKKEKLGKDIYFIEEQFKTGRSTTRSLPGWFFFLLLLIVPLIVFFETAKKVVFGVTQKIKVKRKKTFDIYHKRLSALVDSGSSEKLYNFFIILFAEYFNVSSGAVSVDFIEQRLAYIGIDDEKIQEFIVFFNTCAQIAFSSTKEKNDVLLEQGKAWVQTFDHIFARLK